MLFRSAKGEISNFRTWLTTAISESERLYRVQTQSLNAAEQAIAETRAKLSHAFDRLAHLQTAIDSSLTEENTPVKRSLTSSDNAAKDKPARKSASKKRK